LQQKKHRALKSELTNFATHEMHKIKKHLARSQDSDSLSRSSSDLDFKTERNREISGITITDLAEEVATKTERPMGIANLRNVYK